MRRPVCTGTTVTQKWAELLAQKFNEQAAELIKGLPKISYMTCCFVKTKRMTRAAAAGAADGEADEVPQRLLFAERKIPGEFRKWNTNKGTVIRLADEALHSLRWGSSRPSGTTVDVGIGGSKGSGSSGRDTDGDGDGDGGGDGGGNVEIVTDDIPQAFSHFSLYYSQRPTTSIKGKDGAPGRCLVCDLQGCYDKKSATFTLFDPVSLPLFTLHTQTPHPNTLLTLTYTR